MNSSSDIQSRKSGLESVKALCGLIFSFALGIVIFLFTDDFAPGAVLASIYAGWRSFFTAVWILRRDHNRPRGRICAAFLIATAFWQGAAAAFLALLIMVLTVRVTGRDFEMDVIKLILMQLCAGIVASAVIGILTSVDAAVRAIRVWVHPRLYVVLNQKMQIVDGLFGTVRFNHAVFILATSVGSLLIVCLYGLLTTSRLTELVTALTFSCLFIVTFAVYFWFSRRIIGRHAAECWDAAPGFSNSVLSEGAPIMSDCSQAEFDETEWPANPVAYSCGTIARIGDVVDFDGSRACVELTVTSWEDATQSGVDERGLLFRMDDGSLVFESEDSDCWPENLFIRRG